MDKPSLILCFRALLEERLRTIEASIADTRAGMRVDGCFRPENRGERAAVTSQGYLAAGLSRRASELQAAIELLDQVDPGPRERVSPGALVLLDDGERERWTLLLPGGQGDGIQGEGVSVTVVSPSSPLARALRGREEGEEAQLRLDGRDTAVEILEIR
jgi:transcription elongation GreA/GreB family factor